MPASATLKLRAVTPTRKRFLDLIAYSELGERLLHNSDNGYNVLVGGTLFNNSYREHPNKLVEIKNKEGKVIVKSTAAGRYQILHRYWLAYALQFQFTSFAPANQDQVALQMISDQHALDDVDKGYALGAIKKCANIWVSFPAAGYGQHENKMADLLAHYESLKSKE